MKERSDEEIQREMDEYDILRNKLKDFRDEKVERKLEIEELKKTLEYITYYHSNPHIFEGKMEKLKIGKGYDHKIVMIFWEMYQYGKRNGENPQDIVKDMKIFYNREIKETLPNRGEEIRYKNILDLLYDYDTKQGFMWDEKDLSKVFLNFSSVPSTKKSKTKRHSIPQDVKDNVWNRDGGKCVQCGSKEKIEFDHIIPISKGGSNSYRNLQILCEKCNRSKSDKIG